MEAALPIISLAGVGLQAAGAVTQGQATASADTYQASVLDQQAQYGALQATQTNAQMLRNLTQTLGTIDAVRAAANTDPTSPTGAAVRGQTETIGREQIGISVDNILAQSQMDTANAAYLRYASGQALLSGDLSAGSYLLKGAGGAFSSSGGLSLPNIVTTPGAGFTGFG